MIAGTTTEQALVAAMNLAERGGDAGAGQGRRRRRCCCCRPARSTRTPAIASCLAGFKLRADRGKNLELFGSDFSYEPYGIVVRRDDAGFPPRGEPRDRRALQARRHRPALPALARAARAAGPVVESRCTTSMPSRSDARIAVVAAIARAGGARVRAGAGRQLAIAAASSCRSPRSPSASNGRRSARRASTPRRHPAA